MEEKFGDILSSLTLFAVCLIIRITPLELSVCLSPGIIIGKFLMLTLFSLLVPTALLVVLSMPDLCSASYLYVGDFLTAFFKRAFIFFISCVLYLEIENPIALVKHNFFCY